MARLSVEHYQSNPGTPRPERKSNRFRELFKHLPSSSPSASPNLLVKPQPASSKLDLPNFKPGFEKIGLLPNERSSFEAVQRRVTGSFGGQDLLDMINQKETNISSMELGDFEASANVALDAAVGAQPPSSDIKETMVTLPSTSCKGPARYNGIDYESSSPPPWHKKDSTLKRSNPTSAALLQLGAHLQCKLEAHNLTFGCIRLQNLAVDFPDTSTIHEDHNSPQKSLASNIFDDEDLLSQGVREYVATKIAETISDHGVWRIRQERASAKAPMHFILNINIPKVYQDFLETTKRIESDCGQLWSLPQKLGPVTLGNKSTIKLLQNILILLVSIVLLGSALSGPKDLFLMLWGILVLLGIYATVARQLDWSLDFKEDLLLAPVVYAVCRLELAGRGMLKNAADHITSSVLAKMKNSE